MGSNPTLATKHTKEVIPIANQYTKLTRSNILRKINRKTRPVQSIAQLAREFGYSTTTTTFDGGWGSRINQSAPKSFRDKVKSLVGQKTYDTIKQGRFVNHMYR